MPSIVASVLVYLSLNPSFFCHLSIFSDVRHYSEMWTLHLDNSCGWTETASWSSVRGHLTMMLPGGAEQSFINLSEAAQGSFLDGNIRHCIHSNIHNRNTKRRLRDTTTPYYFINFHIQQRKVSQLIGPNYLVLTVIWVLVLVEAAWFVVLVWSRVPHWLSSARRSFIEVSGIDLGGMLVNISGPANLADDDVHVADAQLPWTLPLGCWLWLKTTCLQVGKRP